MLQARQAQQIVFNPCRMSSAISIFFHFYPNKFKQISYFTRKLVFTFKYCLSFHIQEYKSQDYFDPRYLVFQLFFLHLCLPFLQ